MAESYRRARLPVEFIAVRNAGHDFAKAGDAAVSPSAEMIHQKTIDFFKHYLVPAPYRRPNAELALQNQGNSLLLGAGEEPTASPDRGA